MLKSYLKGELGDKINAFLAGEAFNFRIAVREIKENIKAAIYQALGIAPDTQYKIEKRPFYTTPDGKEKAVMELLA
ncbi:MAG: hypothetical protein EAZ32_03110 [Cytophagia bacterium]|nr:MAG: hypothetical protein EAZ38_05905 [Cytophagales bacterium]TAG41345.1 MAG: hypothetical protein EAZ32_03110 [Cytophagia bacterium]TAG83103.1 MAG: hypothetical protein EAZ22_03480 [Cytophagales bacterium]